MKNRLRRVWVPTLGLVLATAAGGLALAAAPADPADWYDGDNAAVADPAKTAVPLRLYAAGGAERTSGSITDPLASYVAADGAVRTGDDHATLFAYLPQAGTAAGAWSGLQVTGTDAFTGNPRVAVTAAAYTLADVIAAYPNQETAATYAGVYELRLRTSSAKAGVSTEYAAAYVKVTGSTWQTTTAPVPGGTTDPTDPPTTPTDPPTTPTTPAVVGTSVTATWPGSLRYGTASSVTATVAPASGTAKPTGTVKLVSGAETLGTATLAGGTASFALPATLVPGSRTLQVVYDGASGAFTGSSSAARTLTVEKATTSAPVVKVTKKPTVKKAGAATVTVATPPGLATASGKGTLTITQGKTVKKVTVTLKSGSAAVKLKKLPKGKWTLVLSWPGDTYYTAATSKAVKVKSK